MLDQKMQDALNAQINKEMYSAYLYLSIASYFEDLDLPGVANWTYVQAKEELLHSERLYRYVLDRDGRVLLGAIDAPPSEWESVTHAFQNIYQHEQFISSSIHELVDLAIDLGDHATNNFLQWFVAEQVEEEAHAKEVLQKVKLVAETPGGLYHLDRELAGRALTADEAAE